MENKQNRENKPSSFEESLGMALSNPDHSADYDDDDGIFKSGLQELAHSLGL